MIPPGGTTPSSCPTPSEAYTYTANDASVGDVDGDGRYEIILKWDPTNAKDNSQDGCTGNVYLDAYTLTGTRLWRIDLGPNIRAGAHYTPVRRLRLRRRRQGRDGGQDRARHQGRHRRVSEAGPGRQRRPTRCSTATATGYVLSGPEYLTVFNGQTGAELATVNFDQARGTVSSGATTTATASIASWAAPRTSTTPACRASSWRAATTRARR